LAPIAAVDPGRRSGMGNHIYVLPQEDFQATGTFREQTLRRS
jgi:hypothetical protein